MIMTVGGHRRVKIYWVKCMLKGQNTMIIVVYIKVDLIDNARNNKRVRMSTRI